MQRISLGALIISLGLLVDDAIISVEMMATKMEQGMERAKAASFAYTSTAFPMLTGTLITAAGFMPVGFAKSSAGEYTFSIFAVVTIALWCPGWWRCCLRHILATNCCRITRIPDPVMSMTCCTRETAFTGHFRSLVTWCVTWRKTVILITVSMFALSIFGFRFVQQQFFPSSNRPELVVDLWLPQGSSFMATETQVKRLEEKLKSDPNVVNFVGLCWQRQSALLSSA